MTFGAEHPHAVREPNDFVVAGDTPQSKIAFNAFTVLSHESFAVRTFKLPQVKSEPTPSKALRAFAP
jgi:hypothetical protein